MKRVLILITFIIVSVLNAFAVNDTTIVNVEIGGVRYTRETTTNTPISGVFEESLDSITTDGTKTTYHIVEDIPIFNLISGKKQHRDNYFEPHVAQFSVGMNKPMNTIGDVPDNNIAKSITITFIPFECGYRIAHNFGLTFGAGFEWENYNLTDNQLFYRVDKELKVLDIKEFGANAQLEKSKFRKFGFIVPVMLEVHGSSSRSPFFSVGAALNLVPRSRYNSKIIVDDEMQNFKSSQLHHNPVGCDLMAQVGYGLFGFYARYSLTETFKSGHGPQMKALTFGISFFCL